MRMRSGSWPFLSQLVAFVLACLPWPAAGQEPAPLRLEARVDGEALVLSGAFAATLAMSTRVDGVEWLATFDGPVRVELAPGALELASPWIAGVQTGYDTVLVRASREVAFGLTARADGFELRLVPQGPADPVADVLGQRRLELLRAQWYAAQGAGGAELRTLSALVQQAPADARVLAAVGAAERRIGWRRRAADTLTRALAADRADADVRAWLAELRAERAPRLRLDVERREVASEWATTTQRTEGTRALAPAWLFGGRLEVMQFDARRVRRPSGEVTALSRTRRRGEAWLEFDTRAGSTWTAFAAASSSGPGAGLTFARPQPTGRWTLQAEVGRPFWEYAEALADGGTRSRVAVERRQRLGRRADAWVIAFANRYAIEDGASAATAGLTGGVVVAVRQAAPWVAVSYGLDREALRGATQRTDRFGHRFAPVPIVTREVHVPAVHVRQEIRRSLAVDVYAGYAVDRLGGRGPVVEAHVRWSKGRVGGDVWVDRRMQTLATTTTVTRVGASVAIRLGARP